MLTWGALIDVAELSPQSRRHVVGTFNEIKSKGNLTVNRVPRLFADRVFRLVKFHTYNENNWHNLYVSTLHCYNTIPTIWRISTANRQVVGKWICLAVDPCLFCLITQNGLQLLMNADDWIRQYIGDATSVA